MGRAVLDHLVWQLDQCFEEKSEHSLMANLSSVTSDDLDVLPPSAGRTMRDLIIHCASVKRMHTSHAFEDGATTWWTVWDGEGALEEADFEALMAWLRRAHAKAQAAVHALSSDEELLAERRTHWGEMRATRLIIDAILIHDIYHAGEINHLRGLLQHMNRPKRKR